MLIDFVKLFTITVFNDWAMIEAMHNCTNGF